MLSTYGTPDVYLVTLWPKGGLKVTWHLAKVTGTYLKWVNMTYWPICHFWLERSTYLWYQVYILYILYEASVFAQQSSPCYKLTLLVYNIHMWCWLWKEFKAGIGSKLYSKETDTNRLKVAYKGCGSCSVRVVFHLSTNIATL